jgi:hypothetical protein
MGIIDDFRCEKRFGRTHGQANYRLRTTTCCGESCVEEAELSELFLDPEDPSRKLSLLRAPSDREIPCPFCGADDWDLIDQEPLADVPQKWRWACHREESA